MEEMSGKTEKMGSHQLTKTLKIIQEYATFTRNVDLHPSECVDMTLDTPGMLKLRKKHVKCFVFINEYHVYCKYCHYHFYSCSKLHDINSFFQTHINSVDHIWNRKEKPYDPKKPIFIWEEFLYSGFCGPCNRSNIEVFIADTDLQVIEIVRRHYLGERHINKVAPEYLPLLLLPNYREFTETFIKKLSRNDYICILCEEIINRESYIEYHLNLNNHRQNFFRLIQKDFQVELHHLPKVWKHIAEIMKTYPRFSDTCKLMADGEDNKYVPNNVDEASKEQKGERDFKYMELDELGFSPRKVEEFLNINDKNFVHGSTCVLCDESVSNMDRHLVSNTHQLRLLLYQRCYTIRPISLADFLGKSLNPIIISKYEKLKKLLQEQGLDYGVPFKPEYLNIKLGLDKESDKSSEKIVEKTENMQGDKMNVLQSKIEAVNLSSDDKKLSDVKDKNNCCELNVAGVESEKNFMNAIVVEQKISGKNKTSPVGEVKSPGNIIEQPYQRETADFFIEESINLRVIKKGELMLDDSFSERFSSSHPKKSVISKNICEKEMKQVKMLFDENDEIFQLLADDFQSSCMKLWILFDMKVFVCTVCCISVSTLYQLFHHMLSQKHESRLLNSGGKIYSLASYCLKPPSKAVACIICRKVIYEFRASVKYESIVRFIKNISIHGRQCPDSLVLSKTEPVSSLTQKKITSESKEGKVTNEIKVDSNKIAKTRSCRKIIPKLLESVLFNKLELLRTEDCSTAEMFLCVICLVDHSVAHMTNHLKSKDHLKNEAFILSWDNPKAEFCNLCRIIILGTQAMFRQHLNSLYHTTRKFQKSGAESVSKTIVPKYKQFLVIKGMPDIKVMEKKRVIMTALEKFGEIQRIDVKKNKCEVHFVDSTVPKDILGKVSLIVDSYKLNISCKQVVDSVKCLMKSGLIYVLGNSEHLLNYIMGLVEVADKMLSSPEEKKKECSICESLLQNITTVYPKARCFIFGSRASGLTLDVSDLDIFVDCGDYYFGTSQQSQESNHQAKIVKSIVKSLKKSRNFICVRGIVGSRVPIVNCLHKSTNINCDISFKNGLSCENTKLIKHMMNLDSRVKGLILFLKDWIKISGFYGRPYFSSYALIMLVFYYLMQGPKPVLPTVEFLQKLYTGPEIIIAGWNCSFSTCIEKVPKTENASSVPQLILGFFNFYMNFDFHENIICPLTGKPLSRKIFQNAKEDCVPEPYRKYLTRIDSNNYCRESDPICIMDPFDLNHNLTKCFPNFSFELFMYFCRISSNLLTNSLKSKRFYHMY